MSAGKSGPIPATPVHDPDHWPRVRIVNKPKNPDGQPGPRLPWHTKVHVDGVDVSKAVSRARITIDPNEVVSATLELFPTEVEFDGLLARIGPEAHHLLTRLGWTPPEGQTDEAEDAA